MNEEYHFTTIGSVQELFAVESETNYHLSGLGENTSMAIVQMCPTSL